jgi:cell division protease FtsH
MSEKPVRDVRQTGEGRKQRGRFSAFSRVLVGVLLVAVCAQLVLTGPDGERPNEVAVSEALTMLESGDVVSLEMDDQERSGRLFDKDGVEVVSFSYPAGFGPELVKAAVAADVEVNAEGVKSSNMAVAVLLNMLPAILIVTLLAVLLFRRGGGLLSVGKLPGRRGDAVSGSPVRFSDIAGSGEVVEELKEIVDYLYEPERFVLLGARLPKGVLLVGPPGTGKTLLAKAVAGEADVPFFALSGSDFVETFVGVGASRVRQVFAEARKADRAIIFIDELDAVGRSRVAGPSNGSTDEAERTLNALLVEMDGFHGSGVIVMGATNRPEVLDAALLRPGRFDRRVHVGLPDRAARAEILELHLRDRPTVDIDVEGFAKRTVGCSGADLAFIANEAALAAGREGVAAIEGRHLVQALSTSVLGRARLSAVRSDEERRIAAWHEAGHATVALIEPDLYDPVSVSIVPRGSAGGVTWLGGEDEVFLKKSAAFARLAMMLGGRAAEQVLLDGDCTSGASSDLDAARSLSLRMVRDWGMGSVLLVDGDDVDSEVSRMVDGALARASTVLVEHAALFEAIAAGLLEDEELSGEQLARLRATHCVVDDM